jgi:hypothetical protein
MMLILRFSLLTNTLVGWVELSLKGKRMLNYRATDLSGTNTSAQGLQTFINAASEDSNKKTPQDRASLRPKTHQGQQGR